ncbi:MAG: YccF domain-containing protein [Clostridium sp.]|uniref:YccF domain-containing protein n=1 Tax=Clostridium sp. TaxID=1506 RepID=UPI003EE756AE
MSCLGNAIWFIFGGLIGAISWLLIGCLWCITIIGIPVGVQCFKIAGLQLFPFGKEVVTVDDSGVNFLLNILWLIFGGLVLAIGNLITGVLFCITIIGIPFGLQSFKLAKLSLMPFGKDIRESLV